MSRGSGGTRRSRYYGGFFVNRNGEQDRQARSLPPLSDDLNERIQRVVEGGYENISNALKEFIQGRRRAEEKNELLSSHYEAEDFHLSCPILQDFPAIPVRFNGRLYDYDSLIALVSNGIIQDPITREKIPFSEHVIQPDYEAQTRMNELLDGLRATSRLDR